MARFPFVHVFLVAAVSALCFGSTVIDHKRHVAATVALPMSVAEFEERFIKDEAVFSHSDFHVVNKDNDVAVSPWRCVVASSSASSAASAGETMTREITFLRPIRGMSATRATKTQHYTRFPDASGGVLTTSTQLHDLPGSDTFTVDELMTVSRTNRAGGGVGGDECVEVKISYDVEWRKNNYLMKHLVESNTHSAMKGWQNAYVEELARHAAAGAAAVTKPGWRQGQKLNLKANLVSFLQPLNASWAKRSRFNPSWREL
jgi:hypothetical protein